MLSVSCLCGQLRVEVDRRPEYLHECNCTLCRKTGARWAYFHPDQATIHGEAAGYSRQDKESPAALIQFCPHCGSTTHFVLTEQAAAQFGNTMMGVNMRLADEEDLAGIELRFPDGQAWSGAGEFGYVTEPRILGRHPTSE